MPFKDIFFRPPSFFQRCETMILCKNFNSLKDSHMVKLMMAIMFG